MNKNDPKPEREKEQLWLSSFLDQQDQFFQDDMSRFSEESDFESLTSYFQFLLADDEQKSHQNWSSKRQ
jgi:hypothetical protein